jgi:MFS family permease
LDEVTSITSEPRPRPHWITLPVLGIVLATFLSDFGHEACTAVLPLFLREVGLGAAALGVIEGVADFLVSLSKLAGGVIGHRVRHKRPWAAVGYALTAVCTACIGLVRGTGPVVTFRSLAWLARGYRGPLRDAMLSEAVPPTHYGRAFGLERAGDMLGAVSGPLLSALLVWAGFHFGTVIVWTIVPGLAAAAAFYFFTRENDAPPEPAAASEPAAHHFAPAGQVRLDKTAPAVASESAARPTFPARYWHFLGGVFLFGMGDFSRTFLIFLIARALGEDKESFATGRTVGGMLSVAVLLYALHNFLSAIAAYAIGHYADRGEKLRILVAGYALGVFTNVLLVFVSGSLAGLVGVVVLSSVYIAAKETVEKAAAAEFVPRELRSLGFGILASTNAVGDMASSLGVGLLLQADRPELAFGSAAAFGAAGVVWLAWLARPRA